MAGSLLSNVLQGTCLCYRNTPSQPGVKARASVKEGASPRLRQEVNVPAVC